LKKLSTEPFRIAHLKKQSKYKTANEDSFRCVK